ncbi:hypothetical protein BC833DRAFT_597811 [Globomyces pollinis-pini]|nr:hypothetical protein BC833DRAFT_597811 [Globomyces pollinis-pini]
MIKNHKERHLIDFPKPGALLKAPSFCESEKLLLMKLENKRLLQSLVKIDSETSTSFSTQPNCKPIIKNQLKKIQTMKQINIENQRLARKIQSKTIKSNYSRDKMESDYHKHRQLVNRISMNPIRNDTGPHTMEKLKRETLYFNRVDPNL